MNFDSRCTWIPFSQNTKTTCAIYWIPWFMRTWWCMELGNHRSCDWMSWLMKAWWRMELGNHRSCDWMSWLMKAWWRMELGNHRSCDWMSWFMKAWWRMEPGKCRPLDWHRLIHCGLLTQYGVGDFGQHWLSYCPVPRRHKSFTRTNVDLQSKVFCGIHKTATPRTTFDLCPNDTTEFVISQRILWFPLESKTTDSVFPWCNQITNSGAIRLPCSGLRIAQSIDDYIPGTAK